ncbi:MAG: DNA repair protein RadC [Candidatus Kapabacteria bacterium]|nr:DNA repair protein RadC [Ignavibacteriota bacterium]MCW5883451.1 DNA repair protein RadC [Candidatus Kapabacteria bacterium]
MPIKHWQEDDRPRERLIKFGAKSLSDSELIAILIGFGKAGKTAIDIARELVENFGSITELAKSDVAQLKKFEGIGVAKAVSIAAAFEISRRVVVNPFNSKKKLQNSDDIAEYYFPRLRDLRIEIFRILLLNSSNQIIKEAIITEGILNQTLVHPREVFRPAIIESAASIVLIHNHPSGNPEPSVEDKRITDRLVETGNVIGIKVLDHLIFGSNDYYSFKNAGLI